MGKRMVEDKLEEERNKRMYIIGQNGNDGEHYSNTATLENVKFTNPHLYVLNVNNIHDLEDVKDILDEMNLTISIYGTPTENQRNLIEKGLFR
jgi:GTP:adenosylcobinamide-phosphate guanylyltransferase